MPVTTLEESMMDLAALNVGTLIVTSMAWGVILTLLLLDLRLTLIRPFRLIFIGLLGGMTGSLADEVTKVLHFSHRVSLAVSGGALLLGLVSLVCVVVGVVRFVASQRMSASGRTGADISEVA